MTTDALPQPLLQQRLAVSQIEKRIAARPTLSALRVNWLVASYVVLIGNVPFWRYIWPMLDFDNGQNALFALSIPVALFALFNILLSLFAWPYLRKPFWAVIVLITATTGYFMFHYRVLIDYGMVRNVIETDSAEAFSYLSTELLVWLGLLGILPVAAIFWVRIAAPASRLKTLSIWLGNLIVSLLVLVFIAFFFYKNYASLIRNHKELVHVLTPVNVIRSSISFYKRHIAAEKLPLLAIGLDAHRPPPVLAESGGKPKLFVLVVGETARAQNFSLAGYERQTNPRLEARDNLISYQQVSSCGTATIVSVPCMFSTMTRETYDDAIAANQENLVDILQRVGIQIFWRENNNGGCKGVCDRVPTEVIRANVYPQYCSQQNKLCMDDVLLDRLDKKIETMKGDALIVLHQLGSHGPAYYQRYPESMRRFAPTCDTNQIQDCSTEELINTYDNTLLYTDAVLDDTISLLTRHAKQRDVAMLYLSDHGESLGEKGLYLHATPYLIAPQEQKHIPMVLWLSPEFAAAEKLDMNCLEHNAQTIEYSQDNLFHTMLGVFDVRTALYEKNLDLLEPCRG